MTRAAQEFVTALTFQAVSGHPVYRDEFQPHDSSGMDHIALAKWADAVLIAPTSANCLAKCANGIADDILSTTLLATEAPVLLAPAMNQAMWRHPATVANVERCLAHGMQIIGPAAGEQACGDTGAGRMVEPAALVAELLARLSPKILARKSVVITAGPTHEALDPIRYLSNHSSGKMGFALAAAAVAQGATVTLVAGPTALPTPPGVNRINVVSALEMADAAITAAQHADIFIAAAAVADYRPQDVAEAKIKKSTDCLQLTLVKNPDILAAVSQTTPRPVCVGFAAETHDVLANARCKLQTKQLDAIIVNEISAYNPVFGCDDNQVTFITARSEQDLGRASKQVLAHRIIESINQMMNKDTSHE